MSKVVILGASAKPQRYANKAQHALLDHGHEVFLVSPKWESIDGLPVHRQLADLNTDVDIVTLYVNPDILSGYLPALLALQPKVVIFNPGTESSPAERTLREAGIETLEACTLVMLDTGEFERLA